MKESKYKDLAWNTKGGSGTKSPDYPFYNSYKWRKFSKARIKRNPLCECESCTQSDNPEIATMTDHIIPIKQGGAKWDEMNLQSMSKLKCHQIKRSEEAQGIYEDHVFNESGEKISKRKLNNNVSI